MGYGTALSRYLLWNITEIARDFVTERELARFLIFIGVSGITSPIVSLFQKCRRLCHPRIKQMLAPVDVSASDAITSQ